MSCLALYCHYFQPKQALLLLAHPKGFGIRASPKESKTGLVAVPSDKKQAIKITAQSKTMTNGLLYLFIENLRTEVPS